MTTKTIVILVCVALFLGAVVMFIYETHQSSKWLAAYNDMKAKADQSAKDVIAERESNLKKEKDWQDSFKVSEEARKASEAKVAVLEHEKVIMAADLAREKDKTKILPDTDIVVELNKRVGKEFALTGAGAFSLTRPGANATLNRFLDGEFNLARYSAQIAITNEQKDQISILTGERDDAIDHWKDARKEADDCDISLTMNIDARDALEKSIRGMKWKTAGEGAIGGAIFTLVVGKIIGIIK